MNFSANELFRSLSYIYIYIEREREGLIFFLIQSHHHQVAQTAQNSPTFFPHPSQSSSFRLGLLDSIQCPNRADVYKA